MSDLNWKGHLSMAGANIMWGLMSPVAKLTMASAAVTPLLMVDFRVVGAAVLFWITGLFARKEHVKPIDLALLAGASLLGIVFNQSCFIIGLSHTSPGEGSLITTTMPMWVMLLAWLILHEPITLKKAGGIVIGATGAIILVLGNNSTIGQGDNPILGDIIVLAAQFSYALYLTLYRNFIKRYSLITLMKWMFLFATLVSLAATSKSLLDTDFAAISPQEWAGAVFVVVGGTFIAYILVMIGQKNLRPTIVGIYNYVQPIVATCVGLSLGLEHFTASKVLAIILIFTGVYLVTISKSAASQQNADTMART